MTCLLCSHVCVCSLECIPGDNQVTIQSFNVNVTGSEYIQSATPAFSVTVGGTPYLVPAVPA